MVKELLRRHVGLFVGYGAAITAGIFVTIASRDLDWSGATTAVVGCALAILLGLLGTPLVVLSKRDDRSW